MIVKNLSDKIGGDIGRSSSMVVVLLDGVHSLSNFRLPPPLINRWRSGEACDCSWWDIGCQFRIDKPPSLCTSNYSRDFLICA